MNKHFMASSLNSLYLSTTMEILNNPDTVKVTRKGERIKEIIKPTLTLLQPENCFATFRELSLDYLNGELDFYLSGSPFLKDIVEHSKFWTNVSDDGRTINSNYGKLLLHDRNENNYTQWEWARECLQRSKDTKKAVMVIYDKNKSRISNDNPCTMFLQFITDGEGRLHLYTNMRSNDIWFGTPYDVPFFCALLIRMAMECGLELGHYHHTATSLHIYERNFIQVKRAIDDWEPSHPKHNQRELFEEIIQRRFNEWPIG